MDYNDLHLSLDNCHVAKDSLVSLGKCFDNVTLSYKYYWMMALIEKVAVEGITEMSAMSLAIQMVGMAWQPICKHQVGLGYKDGFKKIIDELRNRISVGAETSPFDVVMAIESQMQNPDQKPAIDDLLGRLLDNVPYCYLSPWVNMKFKDCKAAIRQKSNVFEQKCTPYFLEYHKVGRKQELWVKVNPVWVSFIRNNVSQLYDFAMGGLFAYVSPRNEEIQSIEYMLDWRMQTEVRDRQLYFWNQAIRCGNEHQNPLQCLFTSRELIPNCYRLDHFLPSHFADAEKLWCVYPADLSAEVSKTGNHYQHLARLIDPLARAQQSALSNFLKAGGSPDFLAVDYGSWDVPLKSLISIRPEQFAEMLRARFSSATSNAVNRITGYKSTLMVQDDGKTVNNIRIDQNYGPVMNGTSNFKK